MLNKIHIFISIISGIIFTLIVIYKRLGFYSWFPSIVFVLIIGFIVGQIFKLCLKKLILKNVDTDDSITVMEEEFVSDDDEFRKNIIEEFDE